LLRLQLIELIRTCIANPAGDITPALDFASTHLAPRASTGGLFLEDLERTMALLIFPPEKLTQQLSELLDPDLRRDVANRVNEAILASQGEARESRIRNFVRLRAWAEERARESKKNIPEHIALGLDDSSRDGEDEVMNGNGDVDMGA
jgi:glucose-induced degradation protein 8